MTETGWAACTQCGLLESVSDGMAKSGHLCACCRSGADEPNNVEWLVALPDGGQFGPLNTLGLRELVRKGSFSADTRVWAPGLVHWPKLGDVSCFVEALRAAEAAGEVITDRMQIGEDGLPQKVSCEHLSLARTAIAERRWSDADTQVRWALRVDPFHPAAIRLLGLVHLVRGKPELAWSIWEKAQSLYPDAEGLLYLGFYYWWRKAPERAASYWQQAAEWDSGFAQELIETCMAFVVFPDARESCRKVVNG